MKKLILIIGLLLFTVPSFAADKTVSYVIPDRLDSNGVNFQTRASAFVDGHVRKSGLVDCTGLNDLQCMSRWEKKRAIIDIKQWEDQQKAAAAIADEPDMELDDAE